MHPRHPRRGGRERCDSGLWGGGVVVTPLLHTQNCGMSRDRGVATPWSATVGGVASAPLSAIDFKSQRFESLRFQLRFPPSSSLQFPNAVVLNAVGRRNKQNLMRVKERK